MAHTWLRRWRYRMYLHRASFQGEAVLLRLLDGNVQKKARQQLAQPWVREILWRCARECDTDLHKDLTGKLLSWPLEKLVYPPNPYQHPYQEIQKGPLHPKPEPPKTLTRNPITPHNTPPPPPEKKTGVYTPGPRAREPRAPHRRGAHRRAPEAERPPE